MPKRGIESYRGESDQNILTSLGNLHAKMGRDGLESNIDEGQGDYYDKAEECFNVAKHGDFPNAFAYHAHANMLYKRGNEATEEAQRLDYGN